MDVILLIVLCGLLIPVFGESLVAKHLRERSELLNLEHGLMLGSDIVLTENEEIVNRRIMKLKNETLDEGFANPQYYNFSKHFFTYKDEVKHTELFNILKQMPKGALLHGHDTGLLDPKYILNITYWDNLYVCFVDDTVDFLFSIYTPSTKCDTKWVLMSHARYNSGNVVEFDANILKHFTIITDEPNEFFSDINTIWSRFQGVFSVTTPLLTFKPAWEYYFYKTLKEYREDNIMYIELRSVLPSLYDLEGNIYDSVTTAKIYKYITDKFVMENPDFHGMRLIYAPMRLVEENDLNEYIEIARDIKRRIPGFLVGLDLVGQEDLGRPLKDFLPQLTAIKSEFDFFFHAGETNWYGTSIDENIFDAVLLGTRRLGHAYALNKYPNLEDEVKRRDIAIEVNVVSNAVLALVKDVRNHPLATYLARGLPVVICSDDPGVWGADRLTHDYYVSFLGVASRYADLRLLKKLVLNSINYSTVPNKNEILNDFSIRWTHFINSLL